MDARRKTAFHWACEEGNTEISKLILDFTKENDTIDLNARDDVGRTAFNRACRLGNTETAKVILVFLKENGGIDLNARDNDGWTAFHWACTNNNSETVKLIIDIAKENDEIDLNAGDNALGRTAFHCACTYNRPENVQLILENLNEVGIDIKARDNEGKTALGILRLKMQMEFRCMEYSWKEVIAMLEEEYSKLDSSEPAVKRLKKD